MRIESNVPFPGSSLTPSRHASVVRLIIDDASACPCCVISKTAACLPACLRSYPRWYWYQRRARMNGFPLHLHACRRWKSHRHRRHRSPSATSDEGGEESHIEAQSRSRCSPCLSDRVRMRTHWPPYERA